MSKLVLNFRNSRNLLKITACCGRVEEREAQFVARVDNKNTPGCQGHFVLAANLIGVQHSKLGGQLTTLISNNRIRETVGLLHSTVVLNVLNK